MKRAPTTRVLSASLCAALVSVAPVLGQSPRWDLRAGVNVGSDADRYLRVLEVAGLMEPHLRPLRSTVVGLEGPLRDSRAHPWEDRMRPRPEAPGWWDFALVPPSVDLQYNTGFPFGAYDGPVWAGRGITTAVGAAVYARIGPLRLHLAPQAFHTQNRPFGLTPDRGSNPVRFRDAKYPHNIDLPQRFGEDAYGRVDPGNSTLALDLPAFSVGLSSAGEHWGPTIRHPLMLGNNAGGIARAFLATREGLDLWALRLHGRLLVGRLDQSEYSPVQTGEARRLASAAAISIVPRGLQALELGLTRFVYTPWPEDGVTWSQAVRPFSGVTSIRRIRRDGVAGNNVANENQLAGAFARLAPGQGVELYVEIVREDFARDLRHVITQPDDLIGRVFGFQKVTALSGGRLLSVWGESVSAELAHSERLDRFRFERPIHPFSLYQHDEVPQGHTQRGQILASPVAYGGSGLTLGADLYHSGGRWTAELFRAHRLDWYEGHQDVRDGIADVLYGVRMEALLFRPDGDVVLGITPALNMNRSLVPKNDVWNLNVSLSVLGLPW